MYRGIRNKGEFERSQVNTRGKCFEISYPKYLKVFKDLHPR
jgi:hypothetical protein